MNIRITGAPKGGRVRAIPSKSAAHRIMIAAAMSGIDLSGHLDGLSKDITATKECLLAMTGACRAAIASGEGSAPVKLPCGESGSTLRFLIPLAGVLGVDADLYCEGRLPDRPMEPFLGPLKEHGCVVTGRDPKQLRGKLSGGDFRLPGNISSQYVTGLLMALPLAREDSRIIVEGTLQSRPYIDLTLEVLAKAGIRVREHQERGKTAVPESGQTAVLKNDEQACTVFEIAGGQDYRLAEAELIGIEGDWSNGAFWLVMDAMNRRRGLDGIECSGLDPLSSQGDKAIVPIIGRMEAADALIEAKERGSALEAARLQPDISVAGRSGFVEIDVSDIPDLVPAIAVYAVSRPPGAVTHIIGGGRLRYKESDRLRTVTETLNTLGAKIIEEKEGLMIPGSGKLYGGEVSSCTDHRIVMMAAAAACVTEGEIVIRDARAVEKSYPAFFEDYRMLGGSWEVI